jgi:hypothetical protein
MMIAQIFAGDEVLEINGTVVRGRCHLNVSTAIRQMRVPVFKFVILRKKEENRLEDLAVGPISSYPVSCGVQQALDAEAVLSSLNDKYRVSVRNILSVPFDRFPHNVILLLFLSYLQGVRAVRVQKGDSGGGLGIMIIEGRHAAMGQGIFISDIQV